MPAVRGMRQAGRGFMAFPPERRDEVEARRRERFAQQCEEQSRSFVAEVARLAQEGLPLGSAAEALGLTPGQVRRRLRSLGRWDLLEALIERRMSVAELVEEVEFLVSSGESVEVLAARMGMHPVTFERALRNNGHADLLARLRRAAA